MEKVEDNLSDDFKAADRDANCEVGSIAAHWRKCSFLSHTRRLVEAATFASCQMPFYLKQPFARTFQRSAIVPQSVSSTVTRFRARSESPV